MSILWSVLFIALVVMAMVSIDGARKVTALGEARDLADNAARAGAQAVDIAASRDQTVNLDAPAAEAAATAYLTAQGQSPSAIAVVGDTVTVTVSVSKRGVILGTLTATATEQATARQAG